MMVNTKCPICAQTADPVAHASLFQITDNYNHTYQIVKCGHCSAVFTWFNEDIDINQYYDDLDYILQDTTKTLFHTIQRLEYNRVLNWLEKQPLENKRLLDFGCGKGVFLSFAKAKGFDVKGVETSLPRAGFAKKYFGIEVNTDHYEKGQVFPEKSDVLTLFHVIEHLADPVPLLVNLVKDNLKENGILIIETPNFNSWQSRWSGKEWMQLDAPRHLLHCTSATLTQIVTAAGCRIVDRYFFNFHLGVMGMTQTMMRWIGYRGFLMADLKHKRSFPLLLRLMVALPFATFAELIAAMAGKGGVIRYYCRKHP